MNLPTCFAVLAICGLVTIVPARAEDEITRALNRLNEDWTEGSFVLSRQSRGLSANYVRGGEALARALRQEGKDVADRMRTSFYTDHRGHRYAVYTPEQIKAAQDSYELRAVAELQIASTKGKQAEKDFLRRQDALKESATNLQNQLLTKPSAADSIILAPQGTNLYVRNYQIVGEQFEKMPRVQPLRAVQQVASGTAISAGAKGASYVQTNVRGELLK